MMSINYVIEAENVNRDLPVTIAPYQFFQHWVKFLRDAFLTNLSHLWWYFGTKKSKNGQPVSLAVLQH